MIRNIKNVYHYVFYQRDLPNWIVNLNYGSLMGIIAWPLIFFASIFLFDSHNTHQAYREFFLLNLYPFILILITFISYKVFKFNRIIAAILPLSVIGFYIVIVAKYVLPAIK